MKSGEEGTPSLDNWDGQERFRSSGRAVIVDEQNVTNDIAITVAESAVDISAARELFLEYADWLGFSLCFQGFDEELSTLPGKYAVPAGRLLLARVDSKLAGCGALRPLQDRICEMKRLYVRPQFRGLRLGVRLCERLIAEAKLIGYEFMRLDTVPKQMGDANRLYDSLGFYEIAPYYNNPQPEVRYMELSLL